MAPRFNGIPVSTGNRFGGVPVQQEPGAYDESLARASEMSQVFNREPEAAEPSFMDNVLGALGYAGKTAQIGADRFGEGMANVAGLPVDAANLAIEGIFRGTDAVLPGDQSWLKTSSNPLGGSESLNHIRTGAGLVDYKAPEAEDWFQAIFGRVGEELGASALPITGLAAAGGRIGAKAARDSSNWFVQNLVAPAAASPSKFIGSEAAGATAAGMGAGIANMFADRNTTGGQVADMLGALGGAGLYGVGATLSRGLGQAFNAIRQNPNYIDQTVKDAVVDRLGTAAGLDGTDRPIDTDELVELITRGGTQRPSDVIPGFQESVADVTANPGLAAFEYGRQSGPNAGMFTTRRSANNEAVDQVMELLAPEQTPGAFRSELEAQRDLRLAAAADQVSSAESQFNQIIQNLQPRMLAEERGATIRSGLENANRSARELESMAWEGLDGTVDPGPLADTLDSTRGNLTTARQQAVSDLNQTVDIPRSLAGTADEPVTEVQVRELIDMRSKLLDEQRIALSGQQPDRNRANAIGSLIDDINAYMDSDAIDPALRAQFDDARTVSRDVNEQFNRSNDPITQTLARSEGRPDLPDSAVGPRFVQPDNKQASNIDRLLATTDLTSHGGSVREAVKDEILAGIRRNGVTPAGLEHHLSQFTRAFDQFPDLRDEIEGAVQAGRGLEDANAAESALVRDLGSADNAQAGKGTVGRYLQYSDANSERAISEVLSAKDPAAAADELLSFIGDNPSAVEGARAAFWQKLQSESRSAERSVGGERVWRGDWLKSFLDKPATAAVAERLYRDNPEHLANIRDIANVLDNTDLRVRARAPASSGTAQSVNPVLTPETLQSRFYAYMRGQVSGTYLATSIAAVVARRAVRNAQSDAIERLTDKALLNPEFAAELLKENNPANRAALARKARTWLGNEASTFVNLLDQTDEEDGPNIEDRREPLRIVVEADEDNIIDAVAR
ncbi:hypothetical protein [Devosia marina]|uniref:Uncharacterized protein n=1 Tax=Devosia marina TaxID=2683198 RepID=A0A7X3FNM6_9HYPH|nr:hypothetical protein [Devosia marina]MVS97886.1 hypothetical protein [Devosia marina]